MDGPEFRGTMAVCVAIPAGEISRDALLEELAALGCPRVHVTSEVEKPRLERGDGFLAIRKHGAVIAPIGTSLKIGGRAYRFSMIVYDREGSDYRTTFFQ